MSPFAGRGGAVSGPMHRRFIFPGGGSGGAFQGADAPGGRGRPGEGRRHPGRFLDTFCSGVSIARSRTSGLGKKPEQLGATLPPSQCDLQSPVQGLQYTNDMERLTKGRIVASYLDLAPIRQISLIFLSLSLLPVRLGPLRELC